MGYYESLRVNEYKCKSCGHCFDDLCFRDLFEQVGFHFDDIKRENMKPGEFIPIDSQFCPFCKSEQVDVCYD